MWDGGQNVYIGRSICRGSVNLYHLVMMILRVRYSECRDIDPQPQRFSPPLEATIWKNVHRI